MGIEQRFVEQPEYQAALDRFTDKRPLIPQNFRAYKRQLIIPPQVIPISVDITEQESIDGERFATLILDKSNYFKVLEYIYIHREELQSLFWCSSHSVSIDNVVGNLFDEILQRATDNVFVFAERADRVLPLFLAFTLSAIQRFHFDEQRAEMLIAFEKNKVGDTCDNTFRFEFGGSYGITPATVGHGEQPAPQIREIEVEPPHTCALDAMLLLPGMLARLSVSAFEHSHQLGERCRITLVHREGNNQ